MTIYYIKAERLDEHHYQTQDIKLAVEVDDEGHVVEITEVDD